MSQQQLLDTMELDEFRNWAAFMSLKNEDYKEKLDKELALEKSASKTAEQRAEDIKRMLGFYN